MAVTARQFRETILFHLSHLRFLLLLFLHFSPLGLMLKNRDVRKALYADLEEGKMKKYL